MSSAKLAADCRAESAVSDEARGIRREGLRSANAHGGSCIAALWAGDLGGRCTGTDRSGLVAGALLPR